MNKFKTYVRLIPENQLYKNTETLFTYPRQMPTPNKGETINYKETDYTVTHKRHLPEHDVVVIFVKQDKKEE
ncbi:hypothetical protein [Paenibacillus taichungensis]|uniref:hypothetical protein n=1 Tax=Paenibacillus taichungensis TaxID=484184 RepID=UPI0039A283D0